MTIRLRQRRVTRFFLKSGGVLVFSASLSIVSFFGLLHSAGAITSNDRLGPNPDWFQNSARYALENDNNVSGAGHTIIPVYSFNDKNTPPPDYQMSVYGFTKGYTGNALSAVTLQSCSNSIGPTNGGNPYLRIASGCFTYDAVRNVWRADVNAYLANNSGSIQFHMDIASPNDGKELVGYATQSSSAFAIANAGRCDSGREGVCGQYYDYHIPFGTPCTINQNTQVTAQIWDGDNNRGGGNLNIQPQNFSVSITDVTTGQIVPHSFSGNEGNNVMANYTFTVQPAHKYTFNVNHVYTNNVLQFGLPFDSIEYDIDCSWNLTPSVNVNAATAEADTDGINVTPIVTNANVSTTNKNVTYELTRCIVAAGANPAQYSAVADNTSTGKVTYSALGASCTDPSGAPPWGGSQTFASGATTLSQVTNESIGALPVGSRVCYILSINPPTNNQSDSAKWRHSTPTCVVVSKKPKVQVWGGDINAGGMLSGGTQTISNISTSVSQQTTATYGSWGEYGVTATGGITGIGAGSAFNNGLATYNSCNVSALVFTSAGAGSCSNTTALGNYSSVQAVPNVAAAFPISSSTPSFGGLNDNKVETGSGTINIGGGTVNAGNWVVLNAPAATVNITGNINYTGGTLQNIYQIPQVVIIANCINVAGGVTNVDAWLIATGTPGTNSGCDGVSDGGVLNTCSDVAPGGNLSSSICSNKLLVNGPVMARHLYMERTAGAGPTTQAGDPAEVFNLRPDAYLWLATRSIAAGYVQASYTTELPPRF